MRVKYTTLPPLTAQDRARFLKKLTLGSPDECWEWTKGFTTRRVCGSYGSFWLAGQFFPAHRVAYVFFNNTDPGEMFVLHSCDNPPCCNPHHLRLGTIDDNMADKVERGRQCKGDQHRSATTHTRAKGERVNTAKLNEAQVREIRTRRANGASLLELATEFQITRTLVSYIARRKCWNHVE